MTDDEKTMAWTCESNRTELSLTVRGSKGDIYRVDAKLHPEMPGSAIIWSCECKAFQYRGKCRHIVGVADNMCRWNWILNPEWEPVYDSDGDPECPRRGGPVKQVDVD